MTGADLAPAMTRYAAARLPGAVVLADSRRLPFRDGEFDAVCSVWLLHLAAGGDDNVRAIVGECARVPRPGGVYVTTVDKGASHNVGSDIDTVLASPPAEHRARRRLASSSRTARARTAWPRRGRAGTTGHGQGPQPPPHGVADLRRGAVRHAAAGATRVPIISLTRLASLPRPGPAARPPTRCSR